MEPRHSKRTKGRYRKGNPKFKEELYPFVPAVFVHLRIVLLTNFSTTSSRSTDAITCVCDIDIE